MVLSLRYYYYFSCLNPKKSRNGPPQDFLFIFNSHFYDLIIHFGVNSLPNVRN